MDIETDTAEVRGSSGDGHVIYEIHHLADCLQQTDFMIFFIFTISKLFLFILRTPLNLPLNPCTCHRTIFFNQ